MVKKPFKGNYLTFEVRVSYDENTDSIHLTSKDKDIPTANGFHLAMNSGKDAEYALRTLLEQRGLIPEYRYKSIPTVVPYPDSPRETHWDKFPLGLHANGKEAVWDSNTSPNTIIVGGTASGKSVIQRNILAHCSQHEGKWEVFGFDPLRVEFSAYKRAYSALTTVTTTITEGVEMIRNTYSEMMARYEQMEKLGVNYFLDLNDPPKAIMIMIDEARYFLTPVDSRVQETLDENELKVEAVQLLTDIARLGRAAGIHLTLASQELDEDVLGKSLMHNCTTRIAAGPLTSSQSKAILGNNQGTRLNKAIKGRGYLQENGKGADFQGYFAPFPFPN